jgi:hypothetical protein
VRGRKSLTARQPILVSAQLPDPVIPHVDTDDIDSEYQAGRDEETWANDGIGNAQSVIAELTQQQGTLQATNANLLIEAKRVVATEDETLLNDFLKHYNDDPDFFKQICTLLADLSSFIKLRIVNPYDPNSVANALQHLTSTTDPYAPDNLASVFSDASDQFMQAFRQMQCYNTINMVNWLIGEIYQLSCAPG